MLSTFNLLVGAALLILGRKLFWLFVAAGGFIAGVQFAERFLNGPEWLTLAIGILAGVAMAILALFLRVIAFGIAGFFLGGAIFTSIAQSAGFDRGTLVIYLIGGIIGAILISMLFDWAVIVLSSIAGAYLILHSTNLIGAFGISLLLILVLAGIWIQGTIKRREQGADSG